MMDKELLEELKTKLAAERDDLEQELGEIAKKEPKSAENNYNSNFPDFGDQVDENAAEVAEYETNLSVEHNLEHALTNVKSALEKMGKGEYGVCENCGSEIDEARLEAFPSARYCMRCEESKSKKA